ncbi:MAG: sigma-70 family RNA polymerase sigma factor [Saprospiraceae bacterium]|nr:sigma-70 family RNA polymerase sigma factor [Saprospiraceae bacterium]
MDENDADIINEIISGKTHKFSILLSRYNQRLYRVVKTIIKNETEVEDVMQEAYISCFNNLKNFKHNSKFSTWLTRIAVNCALQNVRQKNTLMKKISDYAARRPISIFTSSLTNNNPEYQLITLENKGQIEQIIDDLPQIYKQVFILSVIEKMTSEEIASILDIDPGNVRMRLTRSKAMLKKRISENASFDLLYTIGGERCSMITQKVLSKLLN